MTDHASPHGADPADAKSGLDLVSDVSDIDPEDTEVVPTALTGRVTSARSTLSAMRVNSCYLPSTAVEAVEDTVAALARSALNWSCTWAITPAKAARLSCGPVICSARPEAR